MLTARERTCLGGLPDDCCQCPHWGYGIRSEVNIPYSEHGATLRAGGACHLAPRPTSVLEEDTSAWMALWARRYGTKSFDVVQAGVCGRSKKASIWRHASAQASRCSANERSKKECGAPG